jgi:hypothetical protein
MGFKKIALASDPFQTKMLRKYTRKNVDASIVMIPMVIDTVRSMDQHMTDPDIKYEQAAAVNFIPLPKREGRLKRLKGTWGGNVDESAYR